MSYRTKRVSVWLVLGIVVVAMFAVGFIGNITSGFQNFGADEIADKLHPINEDNLYTAECLQLTDQNDGTGLVIDVDETKGIVKVSGTPSVTSSKLIGTITLDPGTYTFTAIGADAAKNSANVTLDVTGGMKVYADFTSASSGNTYYSTFTIEEETTFTINFNYTADAVIDCTVLPVIVKGTEAGNFYK